MNKLKEYFVTLKRIVELRIAIHAANMKQQAFNKRYYVLPVGDSLKLKVFCADDIDMLKKPIFEKYFVKGHYVEAVRNGVKKRKYVKGGLKIVKVHQINPKVTHLNIMKECFYYTSAHLNELNDLTPAERKQKQIEWLRYAKKNRK